MFKVFFFTSLLIATLSIHGYAQEKTARSGYKFGTISDIEVTSVKNQANTGTCWCFAVTSLLEAELLRMGKPVCDLSEMFTVRNAYIEKGMRNFRYEGTCNFSQGGQAHDVIHMIKKYGIVPEEAYSGLEYGTTLHAHDELAGGLKGFLSGINKTQDITSAWPKAFTAIVETYLGKAPEKFIWNGSEYTPKSFVDSLGLHLEDYIELTSYEAYPFYEQVELEIPDNWMHAKYYNVPLDELSEIMNYALRNNYTIAWDGDVSENGFSHANGLALLPAENPEDMSSSDRARFEKMPQDEKSNLYTFTAPVPEMQVNDHNRQMTFDKRQTSDDHLMHLTGLLEDQNGTLYYRTKNSWGTHRNPFGGYLYMSEPFIRMKTVAILLHKDAIPQAIKAKLKIKD